MGVFTVLFVAVFSTTILGAVLPEQDSSNLKYLLVKQSDGSYNVESLVPSKVKSSVATEKDVNFYLYSRQYPDNATVFNAKEAANLHSSNFDLTKQTLFIIHGWRNNFTSPVNTLIKAAVLEKYDVNLFVVDWSEVTKENYISVFYNVPRVGKYVGKFLNDLFLLYDYSLVNVKVVGHSLGAHVAGVAGKTTNGTLDYIVGLDPAGPMFFINTTSNRLCESDAHFVQVIHTCTKILGLNHSIGHADYYPNGGISQTGCNLLEDLDGSCSHSKSYEYYAESIHKNYGFIATNCDSYNDFQNGNCDHNPKSKMGGYVVNKMAKGKFFLKTKQDEPYAMNSVN